MNKKHISFEEISEQYDLLRSGSSISNEHLGNCQQCTEELRQLTKCIESLDGYRKIVIIDTESFMNDVMSECRKKRFRLLWANSYYRHSIFAAAAVIVVIMIVPLVTSNSNVKNDAVVAMNTAVHKENEIVVNSSDINEIIYFLKKNNFRIVTIDKNRVLVESRYGDFMHLKDAVEGSVDGSLNFVSKRYLLMAGTAAGNAMYVPGADRNIRFSVILKKTNVR